MTTEANDDLQDRLLKEGEGAVEKEGVKPFGFRDANNQYPKSEYENSSSLNFTARGMSSSQLNIGGGVDGVGIPGIPADSLAALPSTYPNVQVKQSASGHVIEMNDTPGGERVLIMHNNGSGIEIRPDGTVVVSSTRNRVEVCGGDNSVIVEGDAHLTYKGNLTLNVTGDYNIDCLNHNVTVRGDKIETIKGGYKRHIAGSSADTVAGNRSETTVKTKTQTQLGDLNIVTKGRTGLTTEGNMDILSGAEMIQTAETSYVNSSPNINLAAQDISVFGDTGTIGGENIIMYNYNMHTQKTVWSETVDTNVVYGDLEGTAQLAVLADTTNSQNYSDPDTDPGSAGNTGSSVGYTVDDTAVDIKATALPTGLILTNYLGQSANGIRDVNIDIGNYLKEAIEKPPLNTKDARAAFRDTANKDNSEFMTKQIGAGSIQAGFGQVPTKLGRSRSAAPAAQRGRTPIGNTDMVNASAPFIMPSFSSVTLPDQSHNVNIATSISQATKLSEGVSMAKFLVGKPLDPALTLDQLKQIGRNYYLHTQFIKTIATAPGRDRKGRFENLRLEIAEGYFRPLSDETVTAGGVLAQRATGNTVVYKLVGLDGKIDMDATFELATMWKNTMSFDKLTLEYDNYNPDGQLLACLAITVPDIPESYKTSFKRVVETSYNNKPQGVGLIEILE